MTTTYHQSGDVITYANAGSALASGSIVIVGTTPGVALVDIATGATGAVALKGVFAAPKTFDASGKELAQGAPLMWDASEGAFCAPVVSGSQGNGDITGTGAMVWADAASADKTVLVRFVGLPGTVKT